MCFVFRHSWRDVFEGIDPKKILQSFGLWNPRGSESVHFWTNGSLFVWVDLDSQWISLMAGIHHDDMYLMKPL